MDAEKEGDSLGQTGVHHCPDQDENSQKKKHGTGAEKGEDLGSVEYSESRKEDNCCNACGGHGNGVKDPRSNAYNRHLQTFHPFPAQSLGRGRKMIARPNARRINTASFFNSLRRRMEVFFADRLENISPILLTFLSL